MAVDHRSIHPNIPGVPWWAAVLIAVTATAVGFAFDAGSGDKELTDVFSALYAVGCVAAVLAVRQSGVFTAVVQPPLILFCAVPGAYFVFHGSKYTGLKDLAFTCGYPLIERFPVMVFTTAGVLLIGMVRWYVGLSARLAAGKPGKAETADATEGTGRTGLLSTIAAKLTSIRHRDPSESAQAPASRRRHTVQRSARGAPRAGRSAQRSDSVRSPEPDRRSRQPRGSSRHGQLPREDRRELHLRRDRPTRGSDQSQDRNQDGYRDRYQDRYQDRYEPPPQRHRPTPKGTNGTTTHHPISRVRYRGSAADNEPRMEPPPRSRPPRRPETWEYDI